MYFSAIMQTLFNLSTWSQQFWSIIDHIVKTSLLTVFSPSWSKLEGLFCAIVSGYFLFFLYLLIWMVVVKQQKELFWHLLTWSVDLNMVFKKEEKISYILQNTLICSLRLTVLKRESNKLTGSSGEGDQSDSKPCGHTPSDFAPQSENNCLRLIGLKIWLRSKCVWMVACPLCLGVALRWTGFLSWM